jgi:hypothetical protein
VSYRVEAPLVLAVAEGGQTHHVYRGGVIEWLSDAQSAYFLAEGLVVALAPPTPAEEEPEARPHRAATKAELIEWLIDNALSPEGEDYTEDVLAEHTKAELWDIIDSVGV